MSEPAAESGKDDPVAELRAELAALKRELQTLAQAKTPAEEKEAKEDVAEAEEDVVAAAKRAGLKPAQYQKALDAARRQAFLDDYGEEIDKRVEERLDAILEEAANAADEDNGGGEKSKPKDEKSGPGKKEPAGPPDTGPEHPHWSERKLSELFR